MVTFWILKVAFFLSPSSDSKPALNMVAIPEIKLKIPNFFLLDWYNTKTWAPGLHLHINEKKFFWNTLLDTHTFTCEMYKWNDMECEKTFLLLDDLKCHIYNVHDGLSSISHFKRQLINIEFCDETFYFASNLFGKKKNKNWTQGKCKNENLKVWLVYCVLEKFLDKTNLSFELILVHCVLK